jgi:hypothetical protein
MPREEIFGKREEEETSSEGEGTRLAPEVARSGVLAGRRERRARDPRDREWGAGRSSGDPKSSPDHARSGE